MFKKSVISTLMILFVCFAYAQESNNGKKLWAKSILNLKAPEITVEKWLSVQPKIEGKFVLVDFWATWCGPCLRIIPKLNEWHKEFGDKLVIIGLSDESEEVVQNKKDIKIDYFSAIDTKKILNNTLKVKGIPHCILIDPDGIVRWEGFPTLTGHELTKDVLENLMAKYPANK